MHGFSGLRRRSLVLVGVAIAALVAGCGSGNSEGGESSEAGKGVTKEVPLKPYEASDKRGEKPDLPGVIAFAQDNPRGFEQLIAEGIEAGAGDAGLEAKVANSGGDAQKQVQNMEQFLVQGVGALVTGPVDPEAQAPVMEQAIEKGADMSAVVFGPATQQVDAPQYAGGQKLAELAAEFIEAELGGKANVVLLNQDAIESIRPRFQAMREVFAKMPGVKIVADVEPEETDTEHGFQTMTTILQKEPNVNVVLGADAVVEGALAAMEAAHKTGPDQFLGGVDCETQALSDIAKEGSYRACIGTEPAIFGYAIARYAGDWLEGKCIPQGISVRPVAVTDAAEVARYKHDESDPAAVYEDPQRLSEYLGLYGNICYETRDNYLAYTWSAPGHAKEGG